MNHIGCIIGRFQPLHKGHSLLINESLKKNKETYVLIGSADTIDIKNPYDFDLRKNIIEDNFKGKNIHIQRLPDFKSDEEWLRYLLGCLPTNINGLTLYCGDAKSDSAILSLLSLIDLIPFTIDIVEIPRSIIPISATAIRNALEGNDTNILNTYLSKTTLTKLKN